MFFSNGLNNICNGHNYANSTTALAALNGSDIVTIDATVLMYRFTSQVFYRQTSLEIIFGTAYFPERRTVCNGHSESTSVDR